MILERIEPIEHNHRESRAKSSVIIPEIVRDGVSLCNNLLQVAHLGRRRFSQRRQLIASRISCSYQAAPAIAFQCPAKPPPYVTRITWQQQHMLTMLPLFLDTRHCRL